MSHIEGEGQCPPGEGNGTSSRNGVEKVKEWICEGNWDVIHFNFGVWEWYGWKQEPRVTPEFYAGNLEEIIKVLQSTDAKIIFATTSPPCDAAEKKIEVFSNDLYTAMSPGRRKFSLGRQNLHWKAAGKRIISPGRMTCHIDPIEGVDAHSGLSPELALHTFARPD